MSSLSIADLLSAYPTLTFGLEEHLVSRPFASLLQQRWDEFSEYLEGNIAHRLTEDSVLDCVRNNLAYTIKAYRHLVSVRAFLDLPLIDKGDLLARAPDFLACCSAGATWSKTTSGTTGPPVTIVYSPHFYFTQLYLSVRKIVASLGDSVCWRERSVWCVHITDTQSNGERVVSSPTPEGELSVQILVNSLAPETFAAAASFLDHIRPVVITSRPELLVIMAQNIACRRYFQTAPPRYVVSSGSALDDTRRILLREALNARLVNAYGLSEFGLVAWECQRGSLHVDETTVLAEVLSANNTPAEEGAVGELVISGIDNDAMPLIRYRTGDRAQLGQSSCTCGIPGRTLTSIVGRYVPCFQFSSGPPFSPTIFNELLKLFPLEEYQITQTDTDEVAVTVEPRSDSHSADLLTSIREYIIDRVPPYVKTKVHRGHLSATGKYQRYRVGFHD